MKLTKGVQGGFQAGKSFFSTDSLTSWRLIGISSKAFYDVTKM
ncbi:hypothetical protein [Dyadobacter sp. 3J3]|nr:hypothetical protein [Dyadobacter sp. 3J3]